MQETFQDVKQDEILFQAMQVGRYTHIYSAVVLVPFDGLESGTLPSLSSRKRAAVLQIEEDAEFHITHVSAGVMAPTGVLNPFRRDSISAFFPAAAVLNSRADRGVVFRIRDGKEDRKLSLGQTRISGPNIMTPASPNFSAYWGAEGYMPLEAVFPPAYGFEFLAPIPWEYHLARNGRLVLDLLNRDGGDDETPGDDPGFHRVAFAFLGQRYDV